MQRQSGAPNVASPIVNTKNKASAYRNPYGRSCAREVRGPRYSNSSPSISGIVQNCPTGHKSNGLNSLSSGITRESGRLSPRARHARSPKVEGQTSLQQKQILSFKNGNTTVSVSSYPADSSYSPVIASQIDMSSCSGSPVRNEENYNLDDIILPPISFFPAIFVQEYGDVLAQVYKYANLYHHQNLRKKSGKLGNIQRGKDYEMIPQFNAAAQVEMLNIRNKKLTTDNSLLADKCQRLNLELDHIREINVRGENKKVHHRHTDKSYADEEDTKAIMQTKYQQIEDPQNKTVYDLERRIIYLQSNIDNLDKRAAKAERKVVRLQETSANTANEKSQDPNGISDADGFEMNTNIVSSNSNVSNASSFYPRGRPSQEDTLRDMQRTIEQLQNDLNTSNSQLNRVSAESRKYQEALCILAEQEEAEEKAAVLQGSSRHDRDDRYGGLGVRVTPAHSSNILQEVENKYDDIGKIYGLYNKLTI